MLRCPPGSLRSVQLLLMLQYEMLEIFPRHAVDRIKKIDTVDHEILLHRLESVGFQVMLFPGLKTI